MSETVTRSVTIMNRRGLHARAAAKFAECVCGFDAVVSVTIDSVTVGGTSIMGLLMLAAATGSALVIQASGKDAGELIDALAGLIERRFDEDEV